MASYQFVYHMDGVSKTYAGGKKVFENIRLNFLPGVKIGVVGVNGAGKSTLLRVMAGLDKDFTGEAWAAKGATVGYLPQEPQLDPALNVRGNVMEGVKAKQQKLDRYNELAMNYSDETAEEMAALQDQIDAEDLWDLDSQIDVAMEALRCPPDDADVETLSGGERRRVALCKLLLEAPDMLLLDEPTNHLDAETIAWLQKHLIEYKGTILIVTHDRYFLDDITGWILELDRGRGIPYEGNYSAWLEQKAKRLEQEAREDKSKQKVLERELEWIRAGAKARQAKQKARINAYNEMAGQSEREKLSRAQIIIPNGERLGNKVIEVDGLKKAMGDKLLIEGLDFSLPPGGIVGVIGPNGAGKSTLFRMLTGQEQPDDGEITYGDTVHLSYVDQSRDALEAGKTVWEEISGGAEQIVLGDAQMNSRAYCGAFNFKGGAQQQKVGLCSGGERNRVHMAKLLKSGGNVLLLGAQLGDKPLFSPDALISAELIGKALALAEKAGVSALVIGVVIVGLGTSMPELATSVEAVLADCPMTLTPTTQTPGRRALTPSKSFCNTCRIWSERGSPPFNQGSWSVIKWLGSLRIVRGTRHQGPLSGHAGCVVNHDAGSTSRSQCMLSFE